MTTNDAIHIALAAAREALAKPAPCVESIEAYFAPQSPQEALDTLRRNERRLLAAERLADAAKTISNLRGTWHGNVSEIPYITDLRDALAAYEEACHG